MALTTPSIDRRDARAVLRQVLGDPAQALPGLRDFYTPGWTARTGADPGVVLAFLFSRLMELLIERLNRVPEKNFIAFLDLLGIDRLPGNPARTPVKFSLPAGNVEGGFVPAGTQVVTGPMPSGATYVFETESGLFVTPVRLLKAFTLMPSVDAYTDASFVIDAAGGSGIDFTVSGAAAIEHSLYLAHDTLLGFSGSAELSVDLTIVPGSPPFSPTTTEWAVAWERYAVDAKGIGSWQPMQPAAGAALAARLLASGQIVFPDFRGSAESVQASAGEGGGKARWIRARLNSPLASTIYAAGLSTLPRISSARLGLAITRTELSFDAAFNNQIPIDLSKDFAPFGAQPKLADTFYFRSDEAFSQPGAAVTLRIELSQGPNPAPSGDLELRWELWNGQRWQELAVEDDSARLAAGATASPPAGEIRFTVPSNVGYTTVGGVKGYWGRVRIVQGNYGLPASYTQKTGSDPPEYLFVAETFRPPMLSAIVLDYRKTQPPTLPQKALTLNSFEYVNRLPALSGAGPFRPFEPEAESAPAVYLGFDNAFGDRSTSLFFRVDESAASFLSGAAIPQVTWEYSGAGGAWPRLELLEDGTAQLSSSGVVSFFGSEDAVRALRFGQHLFWVRARLSSVPAGRAISGVHLNTVQALNRVTVTEEVLGSGNGRPLQKLAFSQFPVLPGESVYVREVEAPVEDALAAIQESEETRLGRSLTREEEDGLVTVRRNATGEKEIWVRWTQVKNFLRSGAQSRHYVLDRVAGTLGFGDERAGMLPPIGRDNIRAFFYQAGGGAKASEEVTAGAVKQLRSPLPFVGAVANLTDAAGGSDPETVADVLERGPQTIENRDRAVSVEDYVWLARQASTLVHQAKCMPTRNERLEFSPGEVAVLIVPKAADPKPFPSRELMRTVRDYLTARTLPGVGVHVVPPQYREVLVKAEVVPLRSEEASIVEGRVLNALDAFLHPVSGGPKGEGWNFGRDVPVSEIHQAIEGVAGVDVVLSVELQGNATLTTVEVGDNELPAPGAHEIAMRPQGAGG